jgi:hypothetical protein
MTTHNAGGFLLLGLIMLWLPALAPGIAAAHTAFGASTREVWLLFMGTLNASLGGGVLGWRAMKQAWMIPAWLEPAPQLRPPLPPPLHASAHAGSY